MANITEAELIGKIRDGEVALFEILIRRNNAYLYKIGRAYGFYHQDVEDLMQETFMSAFKSLPAFQLRSTFKTWITKIMLGHCYRKKHKASFLNEKANDKELTDKNIPMFSNQQPDTEKNFLNLELRHVLEHALVNIPLDYRLVFSLRELSGLSVAETAEALAISEVNVKVRLNRAKRMLRKEIEKSYSPEEIYEFNAIYCDCIARNVMQAIAKEAPFLP